MIIIHAEIKVNPCQWKGPQVSIISKLPGKVVLLHISNMAALFTGIDIQCYKNHEKLWCTLIVYTPCTWSMVIQRIQSTYGPVKWDNIHTTKLSIVISMIGKAFFVVMVLTMALVWEDCALPFTAESCSVFLTVPYVIIIIYISLL